MCKFKEGQLYIRVNPNNKNKFYKILGVKNAGFDKISEIKFSEKRGNIFISGKVINSKLLRLFRPLGQEIKTEIYGKDWEDMLFQYLKNGLIGESFSVAAMYSKILIPRFKTQRIIISGYDFTKMFVYKIKQQRDDDEYLILTKIGE